MSAPSQNKIREREALFSQGLSLLQQQDTEGARFSFEAILDLAPQNFDALHMLAVCLSAEGRLEEAETRFKQALKANPRSAKALINYGITLKQLGRLNEALACQKKAVALQPKDAGLQYNLANSLRETGQFILAEKHYREALRLQPEHTGALQNLQRLLSAKDDFAGAAEICARLIAQQASIPYLHGSLRHLHAQCCDWRHYHAEVAECLRRIEADEAAASPFSLLAQPSSPEQQKRCASLYARNFTSPAIPKFSHANPRIRIGYFSADFFSHATAFLMAELFERHDRNRFEIFAYAFDGVKNDPMLDRIKAAVEHFTDVSHLSDEEIAAQARQDRIDIAVDLKGYTQFARSGIFAQHAAPVQVNYLGFPGSMGAPFIDYIVADSVIIPPGTESNYSEHIIRLPGSYQPNDRQRRIAPDAQERNAHGLPEEGFVFCCFNNNFKITPDIFDIWMRLLTNVDGSVLWLFEDNAQVAPNLRREAAARGVDPQRLIFAARLPLDEHLARHRHADLFLDTHYCNAHTTASDALWAGLPLVTCAGNTFASRVAASLLHACGMAELVTHSLQDYEQLCLTLARDSERLARLREHLSQQRERLPLFDTPGYVHRLESAWAQIHARHQAGLPPAHMNIAP